MSNYKMNGCNYHQNLSRNDYGFSRQNNFYGEWDNEYSNNGWNYYPQEENSFDYDDRKGHDNCKKYDEDDKKECKTTCTHNCFRPCFPSFPCFRRGNIDCRKTGPCYDFDRENNDWKCPCNNNHDCNKKPEHDRRECEKNNRFYFSGCIEFKNFDRKF